jgi:hypothetical protein
MEKVFWSPGSLLSHLKDIIFTKIGIGFLLIFLLSVSIILPASAQNFTGLKSGNYTGVNSVFFNPANIADSPYRWNFNLFGISMLLGNNKASINENDLKHFDANILKDQLLSGKSGSLSGLGSIVFNGPSLFFEIGKKSAVAITTRSYAMTNIVDLNSKLAKQLVDNGSNNPAFPYTLSSSGNMIMNINGFTEFGLRYARVLYDERRSLFKASVTLKYVVGVANWNVNISRLHTTIGVGDGGSWLTNAKGAIALGFGGLDISNEFDPKDLLNFKNTGFGGDIGFVYEYRPNADEMRYKQNTYKFKIGLSVLDIGSVKYNRDEDKSGGYNIHIPKGQRFFLSSITDADIDQIKDTLNRYPQFFTENGKVADGTYRVSLPTRIHLDVDYHIRGDFYVNLAAQAALTKAKKNAVNSGYFNFITITPRYERKHFGVFIPVNYSSLANLAAGIAIRLGPLYVGSGSILSTVLGSSHRADVFAGLSFGGLR